MPKTSHMKPVDELSDPQLVVAIGRYQDEALAEVYRRHGGAVLGLARRVTGSQAEAEDVVQEIFLRFWKKPERFDPTAALSGRFCSPRLTAEPSTKCGRSRREPRGSAG